ncbi:MAG: FtsH protease activity modulator HflK [Burkholderiales bacterium]|nr:FtsH protease activity modulator HflK [Burkholderiales bacterium]
MSQDPNWGRRRNDGPPDLDEIIRRMIGKLKQFFGGKPSGPVEPSQNGPDGRVLGGGVVIVGFLLALLWLGSGFYIVQPSEQAVVLRFGRYVETSEPGPHWRAPWPIGQADIVKVSDNRSVEIGYSGDSKNHVQEESLMLTQDQNIVDMQLEIQYDVKSARDFVFNNTTQSDDGKSIVKQATEAAIREVVGRNTVTFVLNEGRAQVAADATRLIQSLLDNYGTGIHIARVNIKGVQPPEQVLDAFADAVKAGQDKAKQINEGEAYANDVVPKARGTAEALLAQAQGYKQAVIKRAEGDADRFRQVVAEYSKAPQVTRDRMYLDTMQQMFGNTTKVLIDQKAGNSLLYLPFDKLMQANSGPSGTPVAAASAAPSADSSVAAGDNGGNTRNGRLDFSNRGEREGR